MKTKKLDLLKFKNKVDKNVPIIVKFKSDGCPICVDLEPDFQAVAQSFPQLGFYDVDVNEEEDLADLFIEDGVPTLYYIKGKDFKELPYPQNGFDKDSLTSVIKDILNGK
jgi:thioredoxin 1